MRAGGGLRIYLDRPWFVSGFAEMLAVVLPRPGAGEDLLDTKLKPFVTQWGGDPIWPVGQVHSLAPGRSAFPLAKWRPPIPVEGHLSDPSWAEEGSDLPQGDFRVEDLPNPVLPEDAEARLNVAPHALGYDATRGLWYSDIVIRPGNAYFPFVRLALARYHPVSVDGAHLSNVVLAEFQQLTPDRLAVVTYGPSDAKARVAIHGVGMATTHAELRTVDDAAVARRRVEALSTRDLEARATRLPAQVERARGRLEAENFKALLDDPLLISALQPPLLWQGEVALPATPHGGRRRLLITEREVYQSREGPTAGSGLPRIEFRIDTQVLDAAADPEIGWRTVEAHTETAHGGLIVQASRIVYAETVEI